MQFRKHAGIVNLKTIIRNTLVHAQVYAMYELATYLCIPQNFHFLLEVSVVQQVPHIPKCLKLFF